MITYVVGDLFTSPAKVLVNTVNTVGVMGKGIAKDFKRIYPEMFKEYQAWCKNGKLEIGELHLYETSHKWILNFPTKEHWRGKSKIEYLEAGLQKFADTYDEKGIESISFPMLGCGYGGLDWEREVQPLMENYLADLPIDIFIHLYGQNGLPVSEQRGFKEKKKWLQGEPQYPPFAEFWDDVKELIPSEQEFVTLDNSAHFTVSEVSESDGLSKQESGPIQMSMSLFTKLLFQYDDKKFSISKESIEKLWKLMEEKGYLRIDKFPDAMKDDGHIIVSFLKNLSYIQPVWLSERPEVTAQDLGLQLIPEVSERKAEPQRTLM